MNKFSDYALYDLYFCWSINTRQQVEVYSNICQYITDTQSTSKKDSFIFIIISDNSY